MLSVSPLNHEHAHDVARFDVIGHDNNPMFNNDIVIGDSSDVISETVDWWDYNVTSQVPAVFYWMDDRCRAFEFFLSSVVVGVLCVLGLCWNVMTVIVLYRDKQNQVAAFLLQVLAVADSAVLVISLCILSAVVGPAQIPWIYERLRYAIPFMKKYINPLGYITHSIAIWTVVLLAINRFIAVCKPFRAARWLTIRKAQIQVAVVVVASILVNIPRFLLFDIVYVTNARNESIPQKVPTALGNSTSFEIGYFNVFYTTVVLVFPLIFLVGFNAKLIYTLQVSMRNMRRNSLYYIGSQEKNITFVMVLIIIQVLVCHTPDRIITTLRQIDTIDGKYNMYCPAPLVYAQHIANLLIIINCSTNFFIYCIFRAQFRRIFVHRFFSHCGPCGRDWVQDGGGVFDSDSLALNGAGSRRPSIMSARRQSSVTGPDRVCTEISLLGRHPSGRSLLGVTNGHKPTNGSVPSSPTTPSYQ